MRLSAIKKPDGSICMCHGEPALGMQDGDMLIELPEGWQAPNVKYRDCWAEKDGAIVIDLAKARDQKLAEIRAERDKRLEASDKAWMVAMSKGQPVVAINAEKQALRDLPASAQSDLAAKRSANTIDSYEPEWP